MWEILIIALLALTISNFIPKKFKGKRRYWFCPACGQRNWHDRKVNPDVCSKCGNPRRTDKVPPASQTMKKYIKKRDGTCALYKAGFGKCGGKVHVHHIRHRRYSGKNLETNLILLCETHHRMQHPGWKEALAAYRTGNKNAFEEWQEEEKYMTQPPWKKDSLLRAMFGFLFGTAKERERKRDKK